MEYAHFGIPMEESRGRFDEAVAMVLAALRSGHIEGAGPFYKKDPDTDPSNSAARSCRRFLLGRDVAGFRGCCRETWRSTAQFRNQADSCTDAASHRLP